MTDLQSPWYGQARMALLFKPIFRVPYFLVASAVLIRPQTLNPKPSTLNPEILILKPRIRNPKPETRNTPPETPRPETLSPKP